MTTAATSSPGYATRALAQLWRRLDEQWTGIRRHPDRACRSVSLRDQFEFLMTQWANDGTFTGIRYLANLAPL